MSQTFIAALAAAKQPLLGCSVTITSLMTAKIIARAGFQWALIDMEHSPMSPETAMNLVHAVVAASAGTCFPLIRIPSHSVEWIKWAMDSGAAGIIIPMVETKEQMQSITDGALFPPLGSRSFGPNNAIFASTDAKFSTASYLQMAQEEGIAVIPMIESKRGLENVDGIMSVRGVSAVFIGPQDLRLSLGLPSGRDGAEPEFMDAVTKIVGAARKVGIPVGSVGVGAQVAAGRVKAGMSFLLCGLDRAGLTLGITQQLEAVKGILED